MNDAHMIEQPPATEDARRRRKLRRHLREAIQYAASRPCHRSNCGTVCLCGPCHARKALEMLDELGLRIDAVKING